MTRLTSFERLACTAMLIFMTAVWSHAQDAGKAAQAPPAQTGSDSAVELAKKLTNPLSDLVYLPFQLNWDSSIGPAEPVDHRGRPDLPGKGTRFQLNLQPVVPLSLSKKWNIIPRLNVPVISQPPVLTSEKASFGVGDILAYAFLSPAKPGKILWGIGPAFSLPSTADTNLGSGKWSAGPTAVALWQKGNYTIGALGRQIWSFAGNDSRDSVSQMYIEPFIHYTNKNAVTFSVNSEIIANWKEASDKVTAPLIFQVSKMWWLGSNSASYFVGAGPYIGKPEEGPSWKLRAGITIILD
jgi:hypothetical protein